MKKVTLEMIQEARKTIADIIDITPIIESPKIPTYRPIINSSIKITCKIIKVIPIV